MRGHSGIRLFALAIGLILAQPAIAATRSCNAGVMIQCEQEGCGGKEPVHSSLAVDYGARSLTYCVGTACFQAPLQIVRSQDEELFAFSGRRAQPGEPKVMAGLATIHAGGKSATVGRFAADGAIFFSHMICD